MRTVSSKRHSGGTVAPGVWGMCQHRCKRGTQLTLHPPLGRHDLSRRAVFGASGSAFQRCRDWGEVDSNVVVDMGRTGDPARRFMLNRPPRPSVLRVACRYGRHLRRRRGVRASSQLAHRAVLPGESRKLYQTRGDAPNAARGARQSRSGARNGFCSRRRIAMKPAPNSRRCTMPPSRESPREFPYERVRSGRPLARAWLSIRSGRFGMPERARDRLHEPASRGYSKC